MITVLQRIVRGAVMIGLVVVSMTGAITALGDTLFPVTLGDGGLVSHVLDDLSPTQHFLVRLRIVHPIIAIVVALGAWWTGYACVDRAGDELRPVARAAVWIVVIQVIVGMVSIGLGAPGWMQLIHLLLAEALWICFLLLFLSARAPRAEAH